MNHSLCIIGAGRVGSTLALALQNTSFNIKGLVVHSTASLAEINEKLPKISVFEKMNPELFEKCSLFFLTVKDNQIENLSEDLAKKYSVWKGKTVLHCSGLLDCEILSALRIKGANVASLHPLQSFNMKFLPIDYLKGVYFIFEGDEPVRDLCRELAENVGGEIFQIEKEQKVLYHLGATAASNFVVAVLAFAESLLKSAGFSVEEIKTILKPIVFKSVENYFTLDAKQALSGPLRRGDLETVEKHLQELNNKIPQLKNVYVQISKYIAENLVDDNKVSESFLKKITDIKDD